MKECNETWTFIYRIPRVGMHGVTKQFRNAAEAAAFADGLLSGGAFDVRYEMEGS
jgi:hypothetical protein